VSQTPDVAFWPTWTAIADATVQASADGRERIIAVGNFRSELTTRDYGLPASMFWVTNFRTTSQDEIQYMLDHHEGHAVQWFAWADLQAIDQTMPVSCTTELWV